MKKLIIIITFFALFGSPSQLYGLSSRSLYEEIVVIVTKDGCFVRSLGRGQRSQMQPNEFTHGAVILVIRKNHVGKI